jgi:purine nucleosidase
MPTLTPSVLTARDVGEAAFFATAMGRSRAGAANRADAVDFLLQRIRDNPGESTLMVVAPLTNIGAAIDRDLVTFGKLKRVVIMGRIGQSRL